MLEVMLITAEGDVTLLLIVTTVYLASYCTYIILCIRIIITTVYLASYCTYFILCMHIRIEFLIRICDTMR